MTPSASSTAAPTSNDMYLVQVNLRVNESSITFAGSPPRVAFVDSERVKLPSGQPSIVDYYLEAIQVPGLEIFLVASAAQANKFLLDHKDDARTVLLSSHPPTKLTHVNNDVRCMYKYDLPGNQPLGLEFEGSPPKVSKVHPSSPLQGKVMPGQFVEAILCPDGDLNAASPNFSVASILKKLEATNHYLEGRKLVLKHLTQEPKQTLPMNFANTPIKSPINDDWDTKFWKWCCCI